MQCELGSDRDKMRMRAGGPHTIEAGGVAKDHSGEVKARNEYLEIAIESGLRRARTEMA